MQPVLVHTLSLPIVEGLEAASASQSVSFILSAFVSPLSRGVSDTDVSLPPTSCFLGMSRAGCDFSPYAKDSIPPHTLVGKRWMKCHILPKFIGVSTCYKNITQTLNRQIMNPCPSFLFGKWYCRWHEFLSCDWFVGVVYVQ